MDRREFMIAAAAGAAALSTKGGLAEPLSQESGSDLARQVTIYRDNFGVPHILGETEEATFFGYGYAQAQDHLEKMMLQYMDAQGRLSEVLGFNSLGRGYLEFVPVEYRWDGDYLQRLLRTKKAVVELRDKIDPETYKILRGFSEGVNAYIAEHRKNIPSWIEPITPEDVEAEERSNYFRFYSVNEALVKLTRLPHEFPDFGSDHFAISPQKSTSGKLIHFEETHMPWANRFQNYEAHLITPGKLDAGGISWFGSPFFLMGFNNHITWSATWNFPNISDVYQEKINPKNPLQYRYEREWKNIRRENEVFRIKGPNGIDEVTLPCYYTHHGPIVKYDREKYRAYSVKLPNFDGVNYSTGMYGLMKAKSLEEFKAVIASHLIPRWNFLCTDKSNLYWVDNADVAMRAPGFDWRKPVPGWTKKTEWGPYFPLKDLPQLFNPPSNFIQNCNNPPWLATVNSGINPMSPAPYFQMDKPDPLNPKKDLNARGELLLKMLGQPKKFSLDDVKAICFDTYIVAADVIVPLLANASGSPSAAAGEAKVEHAVALLKAWNRRSGQSSVAQTYLYFWGRAYEGLFGSARYGRFLSYSRYDIDLDSPEEQVMAVSALKRAIEHIQSQFGKPDVEWGDINVVMRGGKFPMDGTGLFDVLHPDKGVTQPNGQIYDDDGWGHMMVVVESEPKEVWSLLPYGESEDPNSSHYNDLAKLHSKLQLKRFWTTFKDIQSHTESTWGDKDRIVKLIGRAQS